MEPIVIYPIVIFVLLPLSLIAIGLFCLSLSIIVNSIQSEWELAKRRKETKE